MKKLLLSRPARRNSMAATGSEISRQVAHAANADEFFLIVQHEHAGKLT